MTTSKYIKSGFFLHKKSWRYVVVLILFHFLGLKLLAQPTLIPTIPASNQYPITFTDPDQRIISIEFTESITVASTTTGWTITVGGNPASIVGPVIDPLNNRKIRFQLSTGITYENRNSVIVSYNQAAASPKLAGASGQVASFGPVTAVNNLVMDCEAFDVTKFNYSLHLTEICAPVTVSYTATYFVLSHYVNSINYNPANIVIRTVWGDGASTNKLNAQVSPGVFSWTFTHTYPDDPSVCYWDSYMAPGIVGVGYCFGGGLRKNFSYQNHSEDDEGDGRIQFNTDTIRVCIGQDFSEFFTDATYFNCNPTTQPDFSNDGRRDIRFTYGTNHAAGARIQNVLIDGVSHPLPYQGPVITYDSILKTGVPAPSGWARTMQLSHSASVGPDAVGQIYEIMIENWNPCNPYDIFETNAPHYRYAYIKIVDGPIAEAGSPFNICANGSATMSGQIQRLATAGYWSTKEGDGSFTNATQPSGAIYTPGPNDIARGSVWLYLTATSPTAPCNSHQDSVQVTIVPVITNNTVSASQTICYNSTPANLTGTVPGGGNGTYAFLWERSTTSAVAGFSAAPGTNTLQNYTVPSAHTVTTWYRRRVTSGPCVHTSPALQITVRPTPTATISGTRTVCRGATQPNVTFSNPHSIPITVTYNINGSGLFTRNVSANGSATVSVPTGTPGSYTYNLVSVRYQDDAPGCSAGVTGSATITVRPTPTVSISGATTVCRGGPSPYITFTNPQDIGIRVYYRRNTNNYSIVVPASSTATVAVPTNSAGTFTYTIRYVRYNDNSPGCNNNNISASVDVIVRETPSASIGGTTTVCQNGLAPDITFSNPRALPITVTYNINGSGSYSRDIPANGTATVSVPTGTAGTYTYNLVNARYQDNDPGCPASITGSATVTVRPTPTATISGSTSVCQNASSPDVTFTNPQTLPVTVTYNINGSGSYTINIPASSTATITAPTGTAGIFAYNLVSVVYQTNPTCSNSISGTATITVTASPVPSITGPNDVCAGVTGVIYSTPYVAGNNYSWAISGGVITSGENTNSITVTWGAAGSGWLRVTETNGVPCSTTTPNYVVTINPGAPAVAPSIVTAVTDICKNGTLFVDVTNVATANQYIWDFSWVAGTNNATTAISEISIDLTGVPVGTHTVSVQASNGCGTGPWMAPRSFDINDIPDLSPLSAIVCSDVATGITLAIENAGTYCSGITYNIIEINNGGLSASAGSPDTGNGLAADVISDDAWTNKTAASANIVYKVVPVSSENCMGDSEDVIVIVNPEPDLSSLNKTICSDEATGITLTDEHGLANRFNIVSITPQAGLTPAAGNATTGADQLAAAISNDKFTNKTAGALTVTYAIIPRINDGCIGDQENVVVTVNPEPVITAGQKASVCSGNQMNYEILLDNSTDPAADGVTFTWDTPTLDPSNPLFTGGAGRSTASSDNITDTFYNTTGFSGTATYTIIPYRNGCVGDSVTLIVSVVSAPAGAADTTNACSDNALAYVLQNNIDNLGNGQEANFSWVAEDNPNVTGESTSAVSGGIINDAINNVSGIDQEVIYTVTPTGTNGCTGDSFKITAIIRSEPEGAHDDIEICSGVALNYDIQTSNINALGNGQASTFTWVAAANFNVGGESTSAQTTGTITDVLTNKTSTNQVVIYTVTPTGTGPSGCPGNSFTIFVTVKPEPVITSGQNVTICSGNQMNYEILLDNFTDPVSDGVTFTWDAPVLDPSGNPLFTGGSMRDVASSANITDIFTNTLGGLATATYIITPYRNGCAGNPDTLIVTVGAEPILDSNLNKFACSGQPVELTLKEAAGSVVPTHYNIAKRILSPGLVVSAPADTAVLPKTDALAGYLFNDKYINTTGVNQTVTYSVQPVLAPDCFGAFVDVVVTIRPTVVAGALGGDAEICAGEDAPVITSLVVASGGDGTISYSWYYTEDLSANPGDPGWILISGENGLSYDPGVLTTTTKFTRKAMDGSCPDEAYSNAITITVNPLPVTSEISGPALLCVGAVNQVYSVVNTPGSTYTWTLPDSLRLGSPQGLNFIIVEAIGTTLPGDKITVTETLSSTTQCVGIPVELPIVISPKVPGYVVTGPLDVCVGDSGVIYSVPYNENSSYSWNIPAGAYITSEPDSNRIAVTFNIALSGQISVIETSQSVCTTVHVPVSVTVHALPNVYNVSATQFYCFGTDGVTVSLSGSQNGVNYQLLKNGSPEGGIIGGTGSVLTWSNMTAGIYTVSATNAAPPNCTRMMNGTITVQENPQILISDIAVTQPKCYGGSDGTIVITASGGFPPVSTLTYSIDGGMTFVASNTFNVAAGTYNVVVKDIMNCTATAAPVTIGQPTELVISSVDVTTPVTCYGFSTGSVRVTASGGTLNYSYEWYSDASFSSPIYQTTAEATGLPAGTYYVRVTDANGCFKTGSVVLAQPAQITATAAITSNFNGAHISCNGANNAEITVSASGGTGILSYVLDQDPSNVTGSGSGVFTGVGPGTYTITVTDANLCTQVTNSVVVTEPPVITASAEVTSNYNGSQISCNGASDGRLTVTASGGTGILSYSLVEMPANVSGQITGVFTNLPAGTYTVQVSDKNSCNTYTTPVTISAPSAVTVNASVTSNYNGSDLSCYGSSDGVITALASGGTGALSYSIVQMPGNLTGTVSGVFTGVPAGTYTIRVTDANACYGISAEVIIDNPDIITATGSVTSNYFGSQISCFGAADGEITITANGGTGTLSFVLDQDPSNVSGSSSGVFTGLVAGNYTVTVTDLNGCTTKTPVIIINNPSNIVAVASVTSNYNGSHISCNGVSDGEITVIATGGTGNLNFVLDQMPGNTTGATSGIFTGLPAGSYTVTVSDVNFCNVQTVPVNVNEPSVITATAAVTSNYYGSQISCNGESDGRITVTASGGTGNLSYTLLEIPGNTSGAITGVFTGLPAGSYTFIVTDQNGCNITTDPVTISEPPALTLTINVTSNYNGRDISCFGASDGRIQAVVGGGTGVYFYGWYSDTAMTIPIGQLTPDAINLSAGDYYVKVMDINGCTITGGITLMQPVALDATITSQTNILCYGNSTGSVTVEAVAGTGTPPYLYSHNGGADWQTSGTFNSLAATTYVILVRDANDCLKQVPVTISQPSQLTASVSSITNVSCNGGNNGIITVTATAGSGTAPYTYSIDGGSAWQTDGTFSGLTAGSYNVIVRDNNNCMVTVPVLISEPSLLQLTASPDIILDCYNDKNGSGTFNATGGTLPYTFTYQENTANATFAAPGFNSYSFFNAGAGVITVRVTDNNGCFEEATINLTQPPQLLPGSIEADQVLCAGDNPATITQVTPATGGPGEISYQWQYATDSLGTYFNIASAAGPAANEYTPPANAQSTLYYRRMATSGVCQPVYTDTIMIKVNPRPVAILSGGATICPGDSAVLKVEMPIGVPPFNIVIDNYGAISNYRSEDTIWVKPLATTTYTLQSVTDSNLCAITGPPNMMGSATVIVRDLATITTDPSDVVTCEYGMITFEVGATGSDLLYQWYVNDGNGFDAITDGGIYFGANTSKLYLFGATRNMDGYLYHAEVMTCSVPVTSADALLTVKTNPEIIHQPQDTTICSGGTAEFRISARGTGLTFRWQRNSGGGFTDITDNSNFSGSTDSVLVITDAPGTFNNNIFRVIIDGDCGITLQSNIVALRVNMPPAVNLNPVDQSVCDGSGPVYFVANGSGMIDSLRWQVNIGGAGTWEDIYDNSIYSGTTTQQLALVNIPLSYSTNQYRLALKAYCETVYSNPATLTVNSNPVVSFVSDTIYVCGGVDTPIDPNISGGSGSWSQHVWTGDIGPLSNYFVKTPNFRSLLPVSYDLNYRVKDSNGCYGEGSVVVTVDSPDASFDQDLMTMCTPDTVTFTKDMTGIASFSWNFGDGSPLNTTDANPVHIFTNANASAIEYYNVTLTVVSERGCSSSFTRMTTVYPAVDATFTASADTICSGSTVVFTAMSGASNYYWDYGDLVSGPGSYVATHLYQNTTTAPLTRTVSLITTSFYGCTDVKTVDIVVMPDPMPQFIAAPTPQIFNPAGNVVNFTNQTNAGTWNYLWRFGDGSTSTEENPSHTYTNVGTFNVTLIVDNISCRDSITHQITILPIPPVANFDSIPSGCEPLYINLNNTSLNTETPGTTYRWDFGDGNYSTVKNPTYTYYNPGTYRVELTVTGPGGTSVKSQIVNVYVSPRAYFEVTPTLVFANDERVRCFNLTQFADSYLWEFGDGDTSRQKEPYHRYMEEGVYDITLWAYSNNGCSDVYVLSPGVTVEPAGEIRFSTVFTPNKEGPIERTDLPTGGTEIDQFFFPPIREKVIDYKLQIFNRLGVLIFESRDINVPWNGYYRGQLCPQGVYVWYVEGKYANGKPFKQAGDITLLH